MTAGVYDYEVLAVRYGVLNGRRSEHFYRYSTYAEPDGPLQMDYFFWIVRDDSTIVLVDTGYHPDMIRNRPGRVCVIPPMEALERLSIAPEDVSHIVVTHFHFDHIGNLKSFPNARFTLQRRELDFWTGPHGARAAAAASVEQSEIAFLCDAMAAGRVDCLEGDADLRPGISCLLVPGHCPGQQVVLVRTEKPVLLASDALHFYEEMDRRRPFEVFFDLEGMYRAYDTFRAFEQAGTTIVAGHDPLVMERFPALDPTIPDLGVKIT